MGTRLGCGFLAVIATISICLSCLTVTAASADKRRIDVWDFGAIQQADTANYNNNIGRKFWDSYSEVYDGKVSGQTKGWFAKDGGTVTWGDLSLTYMRTDRLYAAASPNKTYGVQSAQSKVFDDGYAPDGYYYCNGNGGEDRRYIVINNVTEGDTISVYITASNADTDDLAFKCLSNDSVTTQTAVFGNTPARYDFVAEKDGKYKIYAAGKTSAKPCFYRVERIPAAEITGKIDNPWYDNTIYAPVFRNMRNGLEYQAVLTTESKTTAFNNLQNKQEVFNGNFTVKLPALFRYAAITKASAEGFSTNVSTPKIGFTMDSKFVTVTKEDSISGKKEVNLKTEKVDYYRIAGNVTGFENGVSVRELSVVARAPTDSGYDDVPINIGYRNLEYRFSTILQSGVLYTIELNGANDYRIKSDTSVKITSDVSQNIKIEKKPFYKINGKFLELPKNTKVSKLNLINIEDGYTYKAQIKGDTYSASLRDGVYSVEAYAGNCTTTTHIVVDGAKVTKDILFVAPKSSAKPKLVSDIYVGMKEKKPNFNTVKEAIDACKLMNPQSEKQRITVNIAPGTYREQIQIDTPYITLKNANPEKGEVMITWYYGIGYKYYSVRNGYYNYESAHDKYEKNSVSKWGATVYVKDGAAAFRAENIIFEASFNRYVTEEEISDGVEPDFKEAIRFERTAGSDVRTKEATERSSAMVFEADMVEFLNCTFLGSQDTLCAGNGAQQRSYLKNCFIEGNTDFIFGQSNAVFDNCTLSLYGYSKGSTGGYITAAKEADKGYLFTGCLITPNRDTSMTVTPAFLGRPWDAKGTVFFYNTEFYKKGLINDEGWTSMSGNDPKNARFGEYNSTYSNGSKVNVNKRVTGVVKNDPKIALSDYFGDWTPFYSKAQ